MILKSADRGRGEPPDGELVRRARRGEREAFALLYRRHQAVVYRFACAMTGSRSLAEDVVQDVFLALMRDLERYDPERAPLRTYLFGVARNVVRSQSRSVWRLLSLDHADEAAGADDPGAALSASEETRASPPLPWRAAGTLSRGHRPVRSAGARLRRAAIVLGVPVGHRPVAAAPGRQMLLERLRRRQVRAGAACEEGVDMKRAEQ